MQSGLRRSAGKVRSRALRLVTVPDYLRFRGGLVLFVD